MTLIDIIHDTRQHRRTPKAPASKPYKCPAWHGTCSQRCFLRHTCAAHPDEVMALMERLDAQTLRAIAGLL